MTFHLDEGNSLRCALAWLRQAAAVPSPRWTASAKKRWHATLHPYCT